MKLYLSDNKLKLDGYIHIDKNPPDGSMKYTGDFKDFSVFVSAGEVQEIISEVVDLIPFNEQMQTLGHWVGLLERGGLLRLVGDDFVELSKLVLLGEIKYEDLNNFIFSKKSVNDLFYVTEILKSLGMKIINQKLTLTQYMIEAIKQ